MSEHNYMKIKDTVDLSLHSKKLDNLLNYCQKNDTLFVDQEFPPDRSSLVGNPPAQDYQGQWENIDWKRPNQLFGEGQYDLFKGITPNDIRQGALASLAEYPSLISRLFDYDHCNEYGIQSVWLNINGIWKQIILDEYFPANGNQLAFSKTDQKELWVILLEKAYAKAYGSYWEIIGGDPVHALRDLTGAPYDRIDDFSNLDQAWQKLMTSNINQYMLTCFTYSTNQVEEQSDEGLVAGHAYTILDVRQVIDSNGQQRRLVQIRNPWGQFEWNGDFSDNSPLWTQQAKQKLKVKRNDDGIFWMPFEDFVQRFQGVGILKVIPGAVSNAVQIDQSSSNKSVIRLKVRSNSQLMISVDQTDSRLLDNQNYEYSYIRVTLGQLTNNGIRFVDSVLSPERNIFIEKKLKQGEYVLLVETYWNNDITRKLNIGTYSTGNNSLQIMTIKQNKYDQLEYLIWKNFCQKNQSMMEHKGNQQVRGEVGQAQLQKFCLNKQKFANVVYSFVNTSNQHSIREVLNINQHNGFDVNGKLTQGAKADLIINPQDNDILLFKMDPRSSQFSLSYKTTDRELIEGKFSDDNLALQLAKQMGGIQVTPDNPEAKIVSNIAEEQNFQQNINEIQQRDQQRMQQLKERQRAVEQKKNQIIQEMKEQAEFYAKNGGLSQGFMGGNLANLAMKMQQMPLENQWSNRFIETMSSGKKTVCDIF